MTNLPLLIISVFITALLSISGGVFFLYSKGKFITKIQKFGPFFALIMLLYAVFGDIIPEILEEEELEIPILIALIAGGFAAAALIGHFMGHFHHHNDIHHHDKNTIHGDKITKSKTRAYTMLAVDSVHAVADGIVLGTSFIASPSTGLSACLATVAHEIPQEIGDFDISHRAKIPNNTILKFQTLSSLIIVPSAIIAFFIGNNLLEGLPSILAVVAGFLLYVAFGELVCIIETFKKSN
jgi:zinc and cadmium transporter